MLPEAYVFIERSFLFRHFALPEKYVTDYVCLNLCYIC